MEFTESKSLWRETVSIPEREPLQGVSYAEVAVIGGGMAGLLTAYFLQKQGKKVVVLEAARIGSGQTENTTAKITSQHGLVYTSLKRKYGMKKARLYAQAHEKAIEQYQKLIEEEGFDCHFERLPSFLYSKTEEESLKREAETARKLGIPASFTVKTELPFPVKGAVVFEKQAQFHPLEFMKQLAEKLTIYEQTNVLRVKSHSLETNHGTLYADYVVFATHYPFPNVPGFYFVRQHQERSYVLTLSNVPKWKGMFYSEDSDGLSFRWFEDKLLLGGGGHRTGTWPKKGKGYAAYGYSQLMRQAAELFPKAHLEAFWSAQDCITQDDLPFIGNFSIFRTNWYIISGLKKWGMTGAMVSARILCDKICKKENPYTKLFPPWRSPFFISAKKLRKDLKYSVTGLIKGHFHLPLRSKLPEKGKACILRKGFRRFGVYRDLEGKLHWVSVKCPHLGCELVWNLEEKSWDCPCHGSRFDYDGRLLDNPAQKGVDFS